MEKKYPVGREAILRNKKTGEIKVVALVQTDSKQGYWAIDSDNEWIWHPHEEWEKVKK